MNPTQEKFDLDSATNFNDSGNVMIKNLVDQLRVKKNLVDGKVQELMSSMTESPSWYSSRDSARAGG